MTALEAAATEPTAAGPSVESSPPITGPPITSPPITGPPVTGPPATDAPGRSGRRFALSVAGLTAVWAAVVISAPYLPPADSLYRLALFCHLAALVLGFGAVLTVDWFGLMWMLRRRALTDVLRVAHGAHPPIWLGLAGLTASGVVLSPDTSSPLTLVKLLAVLVVALNGLDARRLQQRMDAIGDADPPRSLLLRGALAVSVSQAGWWTATVVGFVNAQH